MKLIVGLGNPGDSFINNRSNIGFRIVDILANNMGIDLKIKKKKAITGRGFFDSFEVTLVKPQTFSNLSGESVLYIASFLKVKSEDIIVIHEDWNIPFGKITVNIAERNLTHPSILSINKSLHMGNFVTVSVGIKNDKFDPTNIDHFLNSSFDSPNETYQLIEIINEIESAVRSIFFSDIEDVISIYSLDEEI